MNQHPIDRPVPDGPTRRRVAVACQGGGSQTAFTAGALRRILRDPGLGRDFELVALSGTSGGAVCCLLAWFGLLRHADDPEKRGVRAAELLTDFWRENSANDLWDRLVVNPSFTWLHRLVDAGMMPAIPPPPGVPGQVRDRLQRMLEHRVQFAELPGLLRDRPDHPTLMCGAVDVLSGQFAVFEECCPDPHWRRRALYDHPSDVCVDTVLASAAVPPLMPAVRVGDGTYWDRMFAHNPPIRALLDRPFELRPDEIWVIEIDPESADHVPDSVLATVDRRFELSSNLSLQAELHWVRQINEWVDQGVLPAKDFKVVEIVRIALSRRLSDGLDLASKVDRDPAYLHELMADGESQLDHFLSARAGGNTGWWPGTFPTGYAPTGRWAAPTPGSQPVPNLDDPPGVKSR